MSGGKTAHDISQKARTDDIRPSESVDFAGLLLSEHVLQGLTKAGFERPSPIQLKAIPLGRCGLDLIVQAKSGTGKTCVFSVVALEGVFVNATSTQAVILAPTREIAVQIWEVINSIGSMMPQLRCYTFIGGMPLAEDKQKLKKCHIAVGTPGRIKQLIEMEELLTESVRLFVLDEADKMMEEGMQETVNWIYSCLPENKQMLAVSATYPEVLAQHLTAYMRNPTFIRLNTSDPTLLGIRQYYKMTAFHPLPQKAFEKKVDCLLQLLSSVTFHQCLVFSNYQMRAQSLSESLCEKGWPATYISGSQDQEHRLTAMAKLKKFKCRVLVSTDLTSRGIDAEHVNLVVNLDLPWDHETYLHRIGRAGRFGSYGASVTLVSAGTESSKLKQIEKKCNTRILELPDPVPNDLCRSSGYVNLDKLVSAEKLVTQTSRDNNKADDAIAETGDARAESDDVTASAGDASNGSDPVAAETNDDEVNSNDATVKTDDVNSDVTVKSDDATVKADGVTDTVLSKNGKAVSEDFQVETCDKESRPDANSCSDKGRGENTIMNGHFKEMVPAITSQNTVSKSQTVTSTCTNQSVLVAPSAHTDLPQSKDDGTLESSPIETNENAPDKCPTVDKTLTERTSTSQARLTDIQQLLKGPNISMLSSQSLKKDKGDLKPWSVMKIIDDFQTFMSSETEGAQNADTVAAAAENLLPDSDLLLKQRQTSTEEEDLTLGLEYMEKLRAKDVSESEGYTTESDYSFSESDYSSSADEKTYARVSHRKKQQNYDDDYFQFDWRGGGDAKFYTNHQDNHQAWYGGTSHEQQDPGMSEHGWANQKPSYHDWSNQHPSHMQADPHSAKQANQHEAFMGLPSNPQYDWLSAHYQYCHWLAANYQLYLSNQSYQHYVYHVQCVNYCSKVQQQNLRFQQMYQQQKAYIKHMSKQ